MSKKLTTEDFIKRAIEVHGNKYDYSKVEYKNNHTKVCIICPEHGKFWQQPNNHLHEQGCPKCAGKFKSTEEIIKEFTQVHGNKYDYSKVEFKRIDKKVCIVCPIHGEFWQEPRLHIKGMRCKYCAGKEMNTQEFIRRAKQVHGNKYDYSKVEYVNSKTKVCIICPEHGEFWQKPNNHLSRYGCQECGSYTIHLKRCSDIKNFLNESKSIHGNKYDYSKVIYYNTDTKVCIICPEHGEFWQTPYKHIKCHNGCPKCKSSFYEDYVRNKLNENYIRFNEQQTFEWLKNKSNMYLDFYLPDYKIAIECQGKQHYMAVDFFGGDEEFKNILIRDKKKLDLCKKHGIEILYFGEYKNDKLIYDFNKLLIKIKNETTSM